MNPETMAIANSGFMLLLCAIPIAIVLFQAIIFLIKAWREAKAIGIPVSTLKRVATNSAVFSIVPSLPIIIILSVLMPALGKYFPWLRLSVIGSAMYESMAATTTVKSFGFMNLVDSHITPSIFLSIAWVMTLGIISYPIANIIFLKRYDTTVTSLKRKGGFIEQAIGALFIGFMAVMGIPELVNYKNPVGITTIIVAGLVAIIIEKFAKKSEKGSILKDFSFPISMIVGMASAIPISKILQ